MNLTGKHQECCWHQLTPSFSASSVHVPSSFRQCPKGSNHEVHVGGGCGRKKHGQEMQVGMKNSQSRRRGRQLKQKAFVIVIKITSLAYRVEPGRSHLSAWWMQAAPSGPCGWTSIHCIRTRLDCGRKKIRNQNRGRKDRREWRHTIRTGGNIHYCKQP